MNAHRESGRFGELPNTKPEELLAVSESPFHSELFLALRDRHMNLISEAARILELQRGQAVLDVINMLPPEASRVIFAVTNENGDVVESMADAHEMYFDHVQDADGEEVPLDPTVKEHLAYEVHHLFGEGESLAAADYFEADPDGYFVLDVSENRAHESLDAAQAAARESLSEYGILDPAEEAELETWGMRLARVLAHKAGATSADVELTDGKLHVTHLLFGNERVAYDAGDPEHAAIQAALEQVPAHLISSIS